MCDQQTNGGGWAVIQRRHDGSLTFDQLWSVFTLGFGNPLEDFWLGNEKIRRLGQASSQLLIQYKDNTSEGIDGIHELYKVFIRLGSKKYSLYPFTLMGKTKTSNQCFISGTLYYFSTRDRDNDGRHDVHYASSDQGGFWINGYNYRCNLNYGAQSKTVNFGLSSMEGNSTVEMKLKSIRGKSGKI